MKKDTPNRQNIKTDIINKIKEIESPEFDEFTKKWIEEYFGEIEKRKQKVSSDEYINWLYNYILINKNVNDESAMYTYKGIDSENGRILSSFFDYIKELAMKQNILISSDEECTFYNEQLVIKIKDKYFEAFRMFGQGTWTSVSLLKSQNEPFAYVKVE